jgi:hypothetical protein
MTLAILPKKLVSLTTLSYCVTSETNLRDNYLQKANITLPSKLDIGFSLMGLLTSGLEKMERTTFASDGDHLR